MKKTPFKTLDVLIFFLISKESNVLVINAKPFLKLRLIKCISGNPTDAIYTI